MNLIVSLSTLALALLPAVGGLAPVQLDPADLAASLGEPAALWSTLSPARGDLAPGHGEAERLQRALHRLRALEAAGGWRAVPDGPALHPGDADPRVPELRRRLLGTASPDDHLYDPTLVGAVADFQRRHGLAADGVVGPRTLAALNLPVAQRRRQVEFSLEQLAALPGDLGRQHVWVNLLESRLTVVRGEQAVASQRVIVGRPDRPTPTLSSRINSLEVNPCWNVPQKLARRDLLPRVRRDPHYLVERQFRVFASWEPGAPELDPLTIDWAAIADWDLAFKLQQQPGPNNALGQVKVLFANPYAVYIHDTPNRRAFRRPERLLSSGCVRIEEPGQLAAALLGGDDGAYAEALKSGETETVPLPQPVEVHLVYLTAWTDDHGRLCFRDDAYARDPVLAAMPSAPLDSTAEPLPLADRTGVHVDEAGARIVADATDALP